MDISEHQVAALKQRALDGDLEALQSLREGGFFKSLAASHGFPASRAQKRLWVSVHRERAGDTYVITLAFRLRGPLRQDALRRALETLHARHETLRTRFAERDGELRQFVDEPGRVPLTVTDFRAASNPEAACREFLQRRLRKPFDLGRSPLWRAHLCSLGDADHVLALLIHHIIADAWSLEILKRELATVYKSYCAGQPADLPPLKHQYRDYAAGLFSRKSAATTTSDLRLYWQNKLASPPPRLQLPTDFPRSGGMQSAGECTQMRWGGERVAALRDYAASRGASLFIVLQALVKVVLYRYTGRTDLIIGTPFAGRNHPELEEQVGLFINLLALRDRIEPEGGFTRLLEQSVETAYEAYDHGDYPFDELVEELSKTRDAGQTPLFDVLVALQNVPPSNVALSDLQVGEFPLVTPFAYYDLTFEFAEQGDSLLLLLTYGTGLFEDATVRRLCGHLDRLMQSVLTEPERPIRELPLLTEAEQEQLALWNRTETAYPRRQTVAELFSEQATATPSAVALTFAGGQLSYRELDERANRLAQYIGSFFSARGEAATGRVIGLCLERSPQLVVCMLGVLKAGAAYLPLDAELPAERLRFMLEDAGASLILTQAGLSERLRDFAAVAVCVDGPDIARCTPVAPPCEASADSLAYVIYTSGSTGKPKGVCVPHYAINRLVRETNYINIGPGDRIAQAATAAFDAATFEIWGALLNCATVHLLAREDVLDPALFARLLRERRVNILFLTTALFNRLVQADPSMFGSLDYLLFGGEAVDPRWVAAALESGPPRHLLHVYGPTESTTFASWYEVESVASGALTVPIGHPLSNTRLHLLDAHRQFVPVGVRGELYIGGDGLARGYLNRAELTAEHFVEVEGLGRLYRTGDLCRRRADGALEFLGRRDEQLKLRGFRIEPGEIESALSAHPEVFESVVVTRTSGADEVRLVAYVAARRGAALTARALREYAKTKLPGYMIPAQFVCMEKLPLNANGKVDRASLPAPEDEPAEASSGYIAPRTPTEEMLSGIWAEVLRRERPGVRDNFFELGGHSLMAMQVLARIRDSFGIELPLHALFEVADLGDLAALIEATRRGCDQPPPPPLVRHEPVADSPLSFAQQRLWFLAQLPSGAGATYSINAAFRLSTRPDVTALRRALLQLTERQQSLRMNFRERAGRPVVMLREPYDPLEVRELSAESGAIRRASELAEEHARRSYDLERDELLRVTLVELSGGEWLLLFGLHHIIADGWSLGVMAAELTEFYEAALEAREPRLDPLPVQYTDYAAWQRAWLKGDVLERQMGYWRDRLGDAPELLELPADRLRAAIKSYRGAQLSWRLEREVADALRELGRREGATLFMTLLAGFKALLWRYTGQHDLIVGTPVANRSRGEVEGLVGFFVNTLALRTRLDAGAGFGELLKVVRRACLDAYAHQDVPFEKLVEELQPERSLGHTPLFQVMFALENAPGAEFRLAGVSAHALEQKTGTAKFDLLLSLAEHEGELAGVWEYSTDLFDGATVARMAGQFAVLLAAAASDPARRLRELPLLTETERHQLLVEWNETATQYPRDATVRQLFEEQAARAPDAVALVFGDELISYGELNAKANRLARYLMRLGVASEQLVGICVERSMEMIVGLLGILKAGGAYVALDPAYPSERLSLMLEETGARLVLTQERLAARLPAGAARVVCLEREWGEIAREDCANPQARGDAEQLAYVSYTSGSTGRPKGVCVTHRAVVRLVRGNWYADFSHAHVFLQMAPLPFDASTFEVWGVLLNGARLVIYPPRTPSLEELGEVIQRHGVTTLWLTAGLFHLMAEHNLEGLRGVRQLLAGGDVLSARHVQKVTEELRGCQLINGYGPTENTTFTCCHPVDAGAAAGTSVPIGRPISNTRVYVLDDGGQPSAVGALGELYAGGDGLARGYVGDAALTAERFVPDPFGTEAGARLYRTGDVVRYLPCGDIEFVGRRDEQLKVRGYRVEPGEIEAALREECDVRDALVVARGEGEGRHLVAYVVCAEGAHEPGRLREALRRRLPDYMIPAHFVALDELPLTHNLKVDRARLPEPEARGTSQPSAPPANERERRLAAVWAEVLGRESVGRTDNFFELGGDSIMSIQIVARAREEGMRFTVQDLFQYQTVAELAQHAREAMAIVPEVAEAGDPVPLTPIQKWFFSQELEQPWHFNQSVLLRPLRKLGEKELRAALDALLEQHAAFRLRFTQTGGVWVQTYADDADALPLHVEDLRDVPTAEQSSKLKERADEWQRSLNLSEGPLARVVLFNVADGQRLLWCVHHLVVDGVSWRILLGDLRTALEAAQSGAQPRLPPPSAPFSAWAEYLDDYARSPRPAQDAAYWQRLSASPALPLDFPDGEPSLDSTAHVGLRLDKAETRALLEEAYRAYNLRINDLLLTALVQSLARWTGRRECVLELEGHGRVERAGAPDVSRTVGWFTTLYPVHLALPLSQDTADCLKAIKEQLRAVPADGLGYGLLRYGETLASQPPQNVAGIAFNYLGQFDQVVRNSLFDFAEESSGENYTRLGRRHRLMDVDAWVSDGQFHLSWGYGSNQYSHETIRQLCDDFEAALRTLIAHCRKPSSAGYTPSDFPLASLTQEQLDAFAARRGRNIAEVYPLSPMQQGMVFHSLFEGREGGAYFEQLHCRVEGLLDAERFRAAWVALLRRHAILRTAFQTDTHPPLQIVYREVELPWNEIDWRHLDEEQQRRSLDTLLADERRRGFDLSEPPLLRCHLARVGDESYQFVWCFHHLLLDGWSLPILFNDLFGLLANPSADPAPRRPFRDYIEWLQCQDTSAATMHWRDYLDGFDAPTPLPAARQSSAGKTTGPYDEAFFSLDELTSSRLQQFAHEQRLTVNTLMQCAWALLLRRYSGEQDVVFGVTVSGRDVDLPGIHGMLGLFINTVPLRTRVADTTLRQWMRDVQTVHQENMRYGHTPLNDIQQCSDVPGGTPLFGTILVFENYPTQINPPKAQQGGPTFTGIRAVDHTSYPLTLVASAGKTIQFRIGYDSQLFGREDIERLFAHVRTLLKGIADADPECRPDELPLSGSAERQQLLDWGRAQRPATSPPTQTLVELFAAQVARGPERVAVVCEGERLTYGALSARAKRLAKRLRRLGAQPDSLIGLCASRSLDLVVGILGILEAGAAYLPLDPEVPHARLAFMLEDARVSAVLTQRELAGRLPSPSVPTLYLEDLDGPEAEESEESDDEQILRAQPQHLAYVIYTSGSTGQPKGVMVTHANVTRLFDATQPEYRFTEDDVWTLFHSFAFDFSVWELWGALLFGGRVVVVPHAISRDPVAFYGLLEAERVTVLNQTPSAFRQLITVAEQTLKPLSLRFVIFGGEALDLPSLRPWFALYGDQRPELVNMYGITETTVHVTLRALRVSDTESRSSLIGRPLADLDLYLLDAQGRPVPLGVAGEIYVGGAGLARGYLSRPELTAERFTPNPFGALPGERLYKTGDQARFRRDGSIEFLGRTDQQVKVRGYRIEPGEIEAALSEHTHVLESVVVARSSGAGEKQLVAYVVARGEEALTSGALRAYAKEKLPDYMIPAHFIILSKLPLTPNGKVDRRALPEPEAERLPDSTLYVGPRDEVEAHLASIWQEALGRDDIGIEHNFFELGGHSLTIMQIVAAVYQSMRVTLPYRSVFDHPTIAALSKVVRASTVTTYDSIEVAPEQPDYPLSHAQQRLWLDDRMTGSANYNMPDAILFEKELDADALRRALGTLVERHEILRTAFVVLEGEPRQLVIPRLGLVFEEVDLCAEARFEERTREIIEREAATAFDLRRPPLFRVTLIKQPGGRSVFVLVMHHIIGDGWSKKLLFDELSKLYEAYRDGLPDPLEPLPIQYKDYAVWQLARGFEREERYWIEKLAGAPTRVALPYDFPPPQDRLFRGDRHALVLDSETSDGLRRLAEARETTLSNVTLALFKLFLFQLTGQRDICVGTAIANRSHPALRKLIGFFVNVLPVRTRLSQEMEFEQLLDEVTQSTLEALGHQDYPFDLLVRKLDRMGGPHVRPFLDVVYVFQNDAEQHTETADASPQGDPARARALDFSFAFAKFDLSLVVADTGEAGIGLSLEYDGGLFRGDTVEGYLKTIERFAMQVAATPRSGREA